MPLLPKVFHVGGLAQCPHGGQISVTPAGRPRAVEGTVAVATVLDQFLIAGCPFQVPVGAGTKPQPCVRVQWTKPATKVQVNGAFVINEVSVGMCLSVEGIPQGPPLIKTVQPRVQAL